MGGRNWADILGFGSLCLAWPEVGGVASGAARQAADWGAGHSDPVGGALCLAIGLGIVASGVAAMLERSRRMRYRQPRAQRPQPSGAVAGADGWPWAALFRWLPPGVRRLWRRMVRPVLAWWARRPRAKPAYLPADPALTATKAGGDRSPCYRQRQLLSKGEMAFFQVLEYVVAGRFRVQAKVHVADLAQIAPEDARWRWGEAGNELQVDFVLCAAESLRPVLAIELDDRAYRERADRDERHRSLNDAMKAAELPLLRIWAREAYDVLALEQMIREKLPARDQAAFAAH